MVSQVGVCRYLLRLETVSLQQKIIESAVIREISFLNCCGSCKRGPSLLKEKGEKKSENFTTASEHREKSENFTTASEHIFSFVCVSTRLLPTEFVKDSERRSDNAFPS